MFWKDYTFNGKPLIFSTRLFFLCFAPFYIFEDLYQKYSWEQVWFITQNSAATQLGTFNGPKRHIWKASFLQRSESTKKIGRMFKFKNILDNITPFVNNQFIYHLSIQKTAFVQLSSHAQSRQEFLRCKLSLPFCLSGTVRFHIFQVILITTQGT